MLYSTFLLRHNSESLIQFLTLFQRGQPRPCTCSFKESAVSDAVRLRQVDTSPGTWVLISLVIG